MNKQQWIAHIAETHSIRIPNKEGSMLGQYCEDLAIWKAATRKCIDSGCPQCKERQKTRKRSRAARAREDAYRSCGLTKVIGSVSGSVYWE